MKQENANFVPNFGQDLSYKEAEQRIKDCRESGGKVLDLSGLGLYQIPPELAELTTLTELSISGNRIKTLPGFIGKLTSLERLDISHNKFSILPKEMVHLSALKTLNLSYNKFTELPEYLEKLTALETLEDAGNKIPALPEDIYALTEPKELNLFGHCERIVELTGNKGLNKVFFKLAHPHISFVAKKLNLTSIQAVLFSHLLSHGENWTTIEDLSNSMHCTRLKGLQYISELDKMREKKLIRCRREEDEVIRYDIPIMVIDALRKGEDYKAPNQQNISIKELFFFMKSLFKQCENGDLVYKLLARELLCLVKDNMHLSFCQKITEYRFDRTDTVLLLLFCHLCINQNDDDVRQGQIEEIFEDIFSYESPWDSLIDGSSVLIQQKIIENADNDNFIDPESFKLTDMAKKELFTEIKYRQRKVSKEMLEASSLVEKKLFYNEKERMQIEQLSSLLQTSNFEAVQERLIEKGMRTGFACLFSGPPGTGKTETVYQIARITGRNIMLVDIAQVKSKWVGESEKNIKAIFDQYREYAKDSDITPILLFNEADAIIGKRTEFTQNSRAVDKMENTIQNIILQEIENFNGILIATTNLTENMDKAFERRFLYKIEFLKPSTETRKSIWKSMIPDLSEQEIIDLAALYDFSGGQIENIARKRAVDFILSGSNPSLEKMKLYCHEETIDKKILNRIGFAV
jgi:SpoVK/Ycf46/Vps4 family AAA+-type ATPase